MDSAISVITALKELDPLEVVALISIVALLVAAYCVRQVCQAISKKGDK